MIEIEGKSPIDILRSLAIKYNGDLIENFDDASLELNTSLLKGKIFNFYIIEGFYVLTMDINVVAETDLKVISKEHDIISFSYNFKGDFQHKFKNELSYRRVEQNQNLIINAPDATTSYIKLSEGQLQMSLLLLDRKTIKEHKETSKKGVHFSLNQILQEVNFEASNRYLGKIDPATYEHSQVLLFGNRLDFIGRLQAESAAFAMLGDQLTDLKNENEISLDLSKAELSRITHVAGYIKLHISDKIAIKDIAKHTRLSPKKLQAGMRHIYKVSVAKFIIDTKLEYAKELIQTSAMSISEVAYEIGVSSRSYFSKIFNEKFDIFPSTYKSSLESPNAVYELSYHSCARKGLNDTDVAKIIEQSQSFNALKNISGCLIYLNYKFFQIIEGPKSEVLKLYDSILKDDRHYDVKLIYKQIKAGRSFPNWNMSLVSEDMDVLNIETVQSKKEIKIAKIKEELNNELITPKVWRHVLTLLKS